MFGRGFSRTRVSGAVCSQAQMGNLNMYTQTFGHLRFMHRRVHVGTHRQEMGRGGEGIGELKALTRGAHIQMRVERSTAQAKHAELTGLGTLCRAILHLRIYQGISHWTYLPPAWLLSRSTMYDRLTLSSPVIMFDSSPCTQVPRGLLRYPQP